MPRTRAKGAMYHRTGQGWMVRWTPEKVAEAPDPPLAFAEYAQQVLGVPWPTMQDYKVLRKEITTLFERYPHLDWFDLCRIVQWCIHAKYRPARVWKIVGCYRYAFRDGYINLKAEAREVPIEERIAAALEVETSEGWRRRLIGAAGTEARREAIREWEARRAP